MIQNGHFAESTRQIQQLDLAVPMRTSTSEYSHVGIGNRKNLSLRSSALLMIFKEACGEEQTKYALDRHGRERNIN
jgi:hypothetical protein